LGTTLKIPKLALRLFGAEFLLICCAVNVPAAKEQATPRYRWTKVTLAAPFAPRDGAGALVLQGKMWLLEAGIPRTSCISPHLQ